MIAAPLTAAIEFTGFAGGTPSPFVLPRCGAGGNIRAALCVLVRWVAGRFRQKCRLILEENRGIGDNAGRNAAGLL